MIEFKSKKQFNIYLLNLKGYICFCKIKLYFTLQFEAGKFATFLHLNLSNLISYPLRFSPSSLFRVKVGGKIKRSIMMNVRIRACAEGIVVCFNNKQVIRV